MLPLNSPPVLIPHHSESVDEVVFLLRQPWRAGTDTLFQAGRVFCSWSKDFFRVRAELEDADVFTSATMDNQPLWELGDVFEMFLQLANHDAYTELHVAPNGRRLHLQFPGKHFIDPPHFFATARTTPYGWSVDAEIPAATLGLSQFAHGQLLRVSFCRYDASRNHPHPVLSTSSPHPIISFHRPDEWLSVCLDE